MGVGEWSFFDKGVGIQGSGKWITSKSTMNSLLKRTINVLMIR